MTSYRAYTQATNEQHSYGRAFRRNRLEQSYQIQWPTPQGRTCLRGIFQKGLALIAALAVCLAVYAKPYPTPHSSNRPLINRGASGNRTNDSGGLNNVSSNGNYWTYAPNRFKRYVQDVEKQLRNGEPIDTEAVLASLNSRLGYLHHFDEYKMTAKAIQEAPCLREVFQFTPSYNKAIIKPTKL